MLLNSSGIFQTVCYIEDDLSQWMPHFILDTFSLLQLQEFNVISKLLQVFRICILGLKHNKTDIKCQKKLVLYTEHNTW